MSNEPIIITKRAKPAAKIKPFDTTDTPMFGMLKNQAKIKSDIIEPIDEKWEAEHG